MDRRRSVVFVGCARNCKPHIGGVLRNVARFAGECGEAAFVFVENDSADGTRLALERWLEGRVLSTLICPDGLTVKHPSRTDRIAAARNAYLDYIAVGELRNFDYLVVIDFDEVNADPISLDAFRDALTLLENDARYAAVFACSDPVYYDVWALRHREWCPTDVWDEVRAHPELPNATAVQRFVRNRQVAVPADSPPIVVQSAFGGLGIYRLRTALNARYDGLTSTGAESCEHVPFNLTVGKSGTLAILPFLRNSAPSEHLPLTLASFPSRAIGLIRKRLMNNILS